MLSYTTMYVNLGHRGSLLHSSHFFEQMT